MLGQQDALSATEFSAAADFVLESGDTVALSSLTILSMVTIGSVGRGRILDLDLGKFESYGIKKRKKHQTIDLSIIHSPIICHQNLYIVEV